MPAGIVAGDILLMFVKMSRGSATTAVAPSTPAGWTYHADHNNLQFGVDHNYAVYSKVADGGEGANITLSTSVNEYGHIVIVAYSGATTRLFADSGSAQISTATPTVPSVTTTVASSMLAGVVFANSTAAGGTTPASGWTQRVDDNESNLGDLIYMMEKAQPTAGASATAAPTLPFTRNCWTYTFAVQPSAAATPVADFTGTPLTGVAPLSVAFTDTSTNTPTSWAWDFGDGGTSTSQNPTHSYTSSGVYTVTLTATNAAGSNTKIRTAYITVSEAVVYAAGGGIDIY